MRAQESLHYRTRQHNYPIMVDPALFRGVTAASTRTAQQMSGILKYNNALVLFLDTSQWLSWGCCRRETLAEHSQAHLSAAVIIIAAMLPVLLHSKSVWHSMSSSKSRSNYVPSDAFKLIGLHLNPNFQLFVCCKPQQQPAVLCWNTGTCCVCTVSKVNDPQSGTINSSKHHWVISILTTAIGK